MVGRYENQRAGLQHMRQSAGVVLRVRRDLCFGDVAGCLYERTELADMSTVKSGDLVEIELEIDSKNDYEYLIFEDPKAAGFEPMLVRSGYVPNSLGAYMELRDEKVAFFVRHLARGKHSISYKMRAEIPGTFSALPTRAYAMYAPELKGNSDEIKIRVADRPLPQVRK